MTRRARHEKMVIPSLVLVLSLTACTPEAKPDPAPQVEFQAPAEPAGPASPGATQNGSGSGILNFTAPRLGGGKVVGSEFAGQNLAVWFWAPW